MILLGEIYALGAAAMWSVSSIFFTQIANRIGSIQLNIYRMFTASVLLLLTFLLFNIKIDINLEQFLFLSVSGIIGLVIGDTFLFRAYKESGPRLSSLLMASNPAMAAIIAFFFLAERLSFWGIFGMIVTLVGISLVVNEKHNKLNVFTITKKGIIFGFFAAVGQAVGLIFAKLAFNTGEMNGLVATFIRLSSAVLIFIPAAIIAGKLKNPVKMLSGNPGIHWQILIGSVIGPYLGITLSLFAIINTKIGIASTLMSTTPVLILPISRYYFKEHLSWKAISGALIAVIGISMLFMI